MNDICLYIDALRALTKILTLFQGASLRITWLYHGQRLTIVTMLQLILAERRLCKDKGIEINNTIRFEEINGITPAAIWLLSDFNFSVVLPDNTSKKDK